MTQDQNSLEDASPLSALIKEFTQFHSTHIQTTFQIISLLSALSSTPTPSTKSEISTLLKSNYNQLLKLSKTLSTALPTNSFSTKLNDAHLIQPILLHLLRQGQLNVAQTFLKELPNPQLHSDLSELIASFEHLHSIVTELQQNNLTPALEWIEMYGQSLPELCFKLHALKFQQLISTTSDPIASLLYAQSHFIPYAASHLNAIKSLTHYLLQPPTTFSVDSIFVDSFIHAYCTTHSLTPFSPLLLTTQVGHQSLYLIQKMQTILSSIEWTQQQELAVSLPVPSSAQFHSVFVCPVSKMECSGENAAMVLKCGHVIGKESLLKLGKGNDNSKFKCPYCPCENTIGEAKEVVF